MYKPHKILLLVSSILLTLIGVKLRLFKGESITFLDDIIASLFLPHLFILYLPILIGKFFKKIFFKNDDSSPSSIETIKIILMILMILMILLGMYSDYSSHILFLKYR